MESQLSSLPSNSPVSANSTASTTPPATWQFSTTRLGSFAYFCVQHPDLFKFIVQVAFSVVVLAFCINQLATGGVTKDGKNDAIYWGGITSILAWWMPSPGGNRQQNQANVEGNVNLIQPVAGSTPPSGTGNGFSSNSGR